MARDNHASTTPVAAGLAVTERASVADETPPLLAVFRQDVREWHWMGYKRMLDILKLITHTTRQLEGARHRVFDIAGEQERIIVPFLASAVATPPVDVASIRKVLHGRLWEGYNQAKKLMQMVCASDAQYAVVDDIIFGIANDQEHALEVTVTRVLGKEQGNG